jgi:hypothetical protein
MIGGTGLSGDRLNLERHRMHNCMWILSSRAFASYRGDVQLAHFLDDTFELPRPILPAGDSEKTDDIVCKLENNLIFHFNSILCLSKIMSAELSFWNLGVSEHRFKPSGFGRFCFNQPSSIAKDYSMID